MKKYINSKIAEARSWDIKKENEFLKVRVKFGSDFNETLPVVYCEHLFPDCDDLDMILECLNENRQEWDPKLDVYDEFEH